MVGDPCCAGMRGLHADDEVAAEPPDQSPHFQHAECRQDTLYGELAADNDLVNLDWYFMDETVNVILTRNPEEMLPSYAKQVQQPAIHDVGYAQHHELLAYLRARGQNPPILDSTETLKNPRAVLTKLCAHIGIPFDEAMLSWPAGARPEDGSWAPYWYASVHQSTGFLPHTAKKTPIPEQLRPLLAQCQPYYEELAAQAIRA